DALLRGGNFVGAAKALRRAVDIDPKNIEACRLFALTLELLGRAADAIGAWISLGSALERCGRFQEAAQAYSLVVKRRPDCAHALIKLGWVNVKLGKPREAASYLEAAIAFDSKNPLAHMRLAWTHLAVGDNARGWKERRWHHLQHKHRFGQPMWRGQK